MIISFISWYVCPTLTVLQPVKILYTSFNHIYVSFIYFSPETPISRIIPPTSFWFNPNLHEPQFDCKLVHSMHEKLQMHVIGVQPTIIHSKWPLSSHSLQGQKFTVYPVIYIWLKASYFIYIYPFYLTHALLSRSNLQFNTISTSSPIQPVLANHSTMFGPSN